MMFDEKGEKTWEAIYDIYGRCINLIGQKLDCPFRYQGQYEDGETGLYYNRFRYYSAEEGNYISQDPIGLSGNNPNFYAYVHDPNSLVDVFGLNPIVVIGEGQKAVDEATKMLRAQGYNAESMMVPKVQWKGGDLTPGMPDAEFQKAVNWNKQWLKDKIATGYKVVDIGRDGRPVPSEFYKAEQEAIKEMGRGKITLKKFGNGETVEDMRKRLKCK